MPRKQVGQVDEAILDLADETATRLGQTRRVYVERALEAANAAHREPALVRDRPPLITAHQAKLNADKTRRAGKPRKAGSR